MSEICTGCGNAVEKDATCGQCGTVQGVAATPAPAAPVSDGPKCGACGNPLAESAEVCGACGASSLPTPLIEVEKIPAADNAGAADQNQTQSESNAAAAGAENSQPAEVPEVAAPATADPLADLVKALEGVGYSAEEAQQLAKGAKDQIDARNAGGAK